MGYHPTLLPPSPDVLVTLIASLLLFFAYLLDCFVPVSDEVEFTAIQFLELGLVSVYNLPPLPNGSPFDFDDSQAYHTRRFHDAFGTDPTTVARIWAMLQKQWLKKTQNRDPVHLLYALHLMAWYGQGTGTQAWALREEEETYKSRAFFFISGIASLSSEVVSRV